MLHPFAALTVIPSISNEDGSMSTVPISGPEDPGALKSDKPHPLGSKARILLASVFGPYARDDRFGSRLINPMELYHNQVTSFQGPF